ncbi:SDR family oxidoreductase [Emcibacter sp. SYSU 3D8]|uniref:SDR family NAD(P)-dependent oxidoreductase n=1 Tax=Emcibacter sp. SYSU 3D8 TaxID=3133969 RepID=UPI0031FE66B8
MPASLIGKTAIVTGAAIGIGRAYAKVLAREGCNVAVIDIMPEILELPNELERRGTKAFAVVGDVSDPKVVRQFVDDTNARFGGVDILINNAGKCWVSSSHDDLDKTLADYDGMVGTNLKGEYLMGRAVIPGMIARGGGDIVNIGTDHGVTCGSPRELCPHLDTCPWADSPRPTGGSVVFDVYDSSKYATYALTYAWAKALRPHNIRVNGMAMGATDTSMLRNFLGDAVTPELAATWMRPEDSAQVVADILKEGPNGRTGEMINLCHGRLTLLEPEREPIYVTQDSIGYDRRHSA